VSIATHLKFVVLPSEAFWRDPLESYGTHGESWEEKPVKAIKLQPNTV
jgi:hypothetical protein